ncbi:MAG: methyltransferase domain-containing protein [candidate division FCPU426 bacterium]
MKNTSPDPHISLAIAERYASLAAGGGPLGCRTDVADAIALRPGQSLLDVGCGRGGLLRALAEKHPEAGRLAGVDASPAMLAEAQRSRPDHRIEWVSGRIEALPFADAAFDWVVCDCSFNHAEDPRGAAAELYRVLKPGGTAVLAEPVTREPLPAAIRQDPQARAACFGGCLTLPELEAVFRAVGFDVREASPGRQYQKNGYDFTAALVRARKGTPS